MDTGSLTLQARGKSVFYVGLSELSCKDKFTYFKQQTKQRLSWPVSIVFTRFQNLKISGFFGWFLECLKGRWMAEPYVALVL